MEWLAQLWFSLLPLDLDFTLWAFPGSALLPRVQGGGG